MDKNTNCPQAEHSELCDIINKARFAMKDDQKYLSKMMVWKDGIIILWMSILNPQPSNLNFEFLIINFQSSYLKYTLFTLCLHLQFLFPLHQSKVQPIWLKILQDFMRKHHLQVFSSLAVHWPNSFNHVILFYLLVGKSTMCIAPRYRKS